MLTLVRRMAVVVIMAIAIPAAAPIAAYADPGTGGVQCSSDDTRPECNVGVGTPARPGNDGSDGGGTGGQGGDGKCRNPEGKEIPCERDGGWAGSDGCYYKPVDLSPTMIENLGGQPAGEGGWYQRVCYGEDGQATTGFGGPEWIAGAPPAVSPEILARQARSKLVLPVVRMTLNPPGSQLARFPVWLTLDRGSWRSESATASVPGVSVTATAKPVSASWSMGDGSAVITCAGPGTRWKPGIDPKQPSPDCGHVYWFPGDAFTVTVTVTWEVTWAGAGQSGTVPGLETAGQVQTRVQQSEALISR